MEHTYLRYECADSFGLVTSLGSATNSRAPVGDRTLKVVSNNNGAVSLVTIAGSYCYIWNCKTGQLTNKLGHAELTGIGTGRALNTSQVLCLDVSVDHSLLATGWLDGAVRIFDLQEESGIRSFTIVGDSQERSNPLTLNGHAPSPVSALTLQDKTRLASGGADGTIIVWDLIAESGLFRLLGHRGAVTQLHFLNSDILSSASLDGLVKVWDLKLQCSVQTMANMRGEIWASAHFILKEEADQDRHRLLVGSIDGQVRVSNVQFGNDNVCHDMGLLEAPLQHLATSSSKADTNAIMSKERILSIQFASPYSRHVAVLQANAKIIHVYAIRTLKESNRKKQRRMKRRQEKMGKKEKDQDTANKQQSKKRGLLDDDEEEDDQDEPEAVSNDEPTIEDLEQLRASDEFEYCGAIKASHKIKAFVFLPTREQNFIKKNSKKKTIVKVACALSTNTIEIHALEKENDTDKITYPTSEKIANLTALPGHPTGVRAIALSSNDETAATISKGTCKLWNVANRSCIQSVTLEEPVHPSTQKDTKHSNRTYQGLCCAFLPGNNHLIVGTKEGHLLIVDAAASEIVYWEEKAHKEAIWSIDIARVNSTSTVNIVTGSADKTVKFWNLVRQGDDDDDDDDNREEILFPGAPMVVPSRVLELTDEVVAVKYSHSNFANAKKRMVFVSTLDCTIKVFFEDSLKLSLSLYGHKLPALAVDASDDDVLLVSGSADKTIKLHGLDWGDTHKTLHGHTDSVTDVKFVRGTHYFFSASKDGTVRYWDGDRFEQVLVLRGHGAEVNCLAVSARDGGAVCLSGGMDRQVRVYERTKDIVFLQEERERELEQMFDEDPNRRDEQGTANILARKGTKGEGGEDVEMSETEPQSEAAVKRSIMSINAGDRLLEALELADQELYASRTKSKDGSVGRVNPMLMSKDPPHYVLWILKSIKSVDLEQALLVLPLRHAERLLFYLALLLKEGPLNVELCCRVAVSTFKAHQNEILMSHNQKAMAPLLRELRRLLHLRLQEAKDTIGYNLAGIRMVTRIAKEQKESKMFNIQPSSTDVWAGMGLGSDVAAALEGPSKKKKGR